jgi:hypothetical protein
VGKVNEQLSILSLVEGVNCALIPCDSTLGVFSSSFNFSENDVG